jgi:hypothetical protein
LERANFALLPLSFSFSNPISTHTSPPFFFPPSPKGGKEERERGGEEKYLEKDGESRRTRDEKDPQ